MHEQGRAVRRERMLKLYDEGRLVSSDPAISAKGLTKEEVIAADAAGKLVGTNGFTTIFAHCSVCPWKDHEHVEANNVARTEIFYYFREEHSFDTARAMNGEPCDGFLDFDEKHG